MFVNTQSYPVFYNGHYGFFVSWCRKKFDKRNAQDLVQEAFIKLWIVLRNGNSIEKPLSYVMRIITNLYIDDLKREQNRNRLLADLLRDKRLEEKNNVYIDPSDNDAEEIEILAALETFKLVYDKLPKDCKELVGYLWEGKRKREIAVILGVPPKTVKNLWQKVRFIFNKELKKKSDERDDDPC